MIILGISAYYHDSAAAIIKNGEVIAAFEEERFTRKKHDNGFPTMAVDACLKASNITIDEVDIVSYYEKPLLKFERILETFITTYPFSIRPFIKTMPEWLSEKIKVEKAIRKNLDFKKKVYFIPHHLSHAAASYYPSPFSKAAVLTSDGTGEYQTTALWLGEGKNIKLLNELHFPHSLGLLYSTFTAFLGFKVNDDEYKVMGMAAYGKPKYVKDIYETMDLLPDGSFKLDMSYFSYREGFRMWSNKFERYFGSPRKPDGTVKQRHKDIAASIQVVMEEIYIRTLKQLHSLTKTPNLCIGGGVALNALANGKIFSSTPFEKVYAMGASGDSGGAIGAALYASIVSKNKRRALHSLQVGNAYSDQELYDLVKESGFINKKFNQETLIRESAKLLKRGRIIGWFQGKMEFGPRALGARSILAAPYPARMKDKVNIIKRRELFRPFAGSVITEQASSYFSLPKSQADFPFMNFCFEVKKNDEIPAITHKDKTCRIQTVSPDNKLYYALIKEFFKLTGIPVILNTSFNLKGEPIVETPQQAIEDFKKTKMDALVIGSYILYKK